MTTCPLFGKCGGCKFDFTSDVYRESKSASLKKFPVTNDPIWIQDGWRRRADFAFTDGRFGFFEKGSKNVVPIIHCIGLKKSLNDLLPAMAAMPWIGAGGVLITECDNGIDIAVTSKVPYFTSDFKKAVDMLPVIRVMWNDKVVKQTVQPVIKFDDVTVDYPVGGFLQPTQESEKILRDLVIFHAMGHKKIADLFCGLGNFTFALKADGFDIIGGIHRDLFKKPLTVQNLKKYYCVIMDPPRAGAWEQSRELAKSTVEKVIYVSCNPDTFMRDSDVLVRGGFKLTELTPVDQFVGSDHWEFIGVFKRQ